MPPNLHSRRWSPRLLKLAALAGGGYFVVRQWWHTDNDPASSAAAGPRKPTPWPPPLYDALEGSSASRHVRARFQNRELAQRGLEKECTDTTWVAFDDRDGFAMVEELHRLVRADGTNECTVRTWMASTRDGFPVIYTTRRQVGMMNGPVQKGDLQSCSKKSGGAWACDARSFYEVHYHLKWLGGMGMQLNQKPPPVGYVEEHTPDARAECPPAIPVGQQWWAAAGRHMEDSFPGGRVPPAEGDERSGFLLAPHLTISEDTGK